MGSIYGEWGSHWGIVFLYYIAYVYKSLGHRPRQDNKINHEEQWDGYGDMPRHLGKRE